MKLIYIANARIPTEKAHGYQICKMCEEFARAGTTVELWLPIRDNSIKEDPFFIYGLEKNFKIVRIKSFDFFRWEKYLGRASFVLQTLFFMIKFLFVKPDQGAIIYTRDVGTAWLFSRRGCRTAYEAHSWPAGKNFFYQYLFKNVNYIIAITNGLREVFLAQGFADDKILVAPDGVDLKKFDIEMSRKEARQKVNLPLAKKIILYSGSFYLYDWKGVDVLLAAAKYFSNNELLVLVGANESEIKEITGQKFGKNLLLVGRQPYEKVPYYLKAADILVLPNKQGDLMSEKYTSPLKLFEYLASGRPIVASRLPSLAEILNEGNAILVEPNNPKSLADGLKNILNNSPLADKISSQARRDAQNYSWDKRAVNIINFIK